jgi:hypothetical protein
MSFANSFVLNFKSRVRIIPLSEGVYEHTGMFLIAFPRRRSQFPISRGAWPFLSDQHRILHSSFRIRYSSAFTA